MRRSRLVSIVFLLVCLVGLLTLAQSNPAPIASHRGFVENQTLRAEVPLFPETKPPLHFGKVVNYAFGASGSRSVQVADLNADGHLDVVLANACLDSHNCTSGGVTVLLGKGDGTLQVAGTYPSGGYDPFAVAVGDVNGDGRPDIVVANWCVDQQCDGNYQGEVGVLLGNGDGTFQSPITFSSGGTLATGVAVTDLNHDGYADIAVSNLYGTVTVFISNGNGTFQSPVSYGTGGVDGASVAIADLNGDGFPDLVVGNDCSDYNCTASSVGVLLGNGDGTFRGPTVYASGQNQARSIAIADLNGDGYLDIVVANNPCGNSGDCGHNSATVLLGNGDGTFQPAVSYSAGNASWVAVGDVNGDGYPDLVLSDMVCGAKACGKGLVDVMLGNGDGSFQPPVSFTSGGEAPESISVADLNGDGMPDIIVGDYTKSSSVVGVMLNHFLSPTKTKLASSPNPSHVGESVTFTATITPAVPNGETVTFYNGATQIGTGTTSGGIATFTTSFSASGKYTIKAAYSGDAFHKASSGKVKQVVNP